MSGAASDWLPADVAARHVVRARVADAVAAWSADWLVQRPLAAGEFRVERGPAPAREGGPWRRFGNAVAVHAAPRALERLLAWALDVRLEDQPVNDADRALLSAFEAELLGDLCARVEAELGIEGERPDEPLATADPLGRLGGAIISIDDRHDAALVWLALPLRAALPLCRQSLPPRATQSVRLQPIVRALGPTKVDLEAILGSAQIGLADLRGLGPGDVVVLDRPVTAPVDLTAAGLAHPAARAQLTEADGQVALTLLA